MPLDFIGFHCFSVCASSEAWGQHDELEVHAAAGPGDSGRWRRDALRWALGGWWLARLVHRRLGRLGLWQRPQGQAESLTESKELKEC